jgi:hypothetical protein
LHNYYLFDIILARFLFLKIIVKVNEVKKENFVDYSNETADMTIKSLMEKGYSVCQASSYLSKLRIKKLFESDNGGKNADYNRDLFGTPPDRMAGWKNKSKKCT